ncbi:MAG: GNAT family N-acetyltransferase, partial [Gammaproteobacteria bacterium]|nr:GNAT family N-acetyltransferase [Gammaproteobacteria bacterium]
RENSALLKLISNNAMNAVDGNGVKRIVSVIGIQGIEIRQVNKSDTQHLFEWRNHPKIRSVSKNNTPITWEEHQRWFYEVAGNNDRELLIGTSADEPVGIVRFDKEDNVAEVSIYLVPDSGFSGQGRNLLFSAEQWLRANRPDIKDIRACVLGTNEVSKNLFLGSNYLINMIYYKKTL